MGEEGLDLGDETAGELELLEDGKETVLGHMVKSTFDVYEDSGGSIIKISLSLHIYNEEVGSSNVSLIDYGS